MDRWKNNRINEWTWRNGEVGQNVDNCWIWVGALWKLMNYSFYFSVWLKFFLRQSLKTITDDAFRESSHRHSGANARNGIRLVVSRLHTPCPPTLPHPILSRQMGPALPPDPTPPTTTTFLTSIRAPFSLSSDRLALSNSSCISDSWSWRSLISVWCCSRSIFTWNSLAGEEAHQRDCAKPYIFFIQSDLKHTDG